LPPPILLIVLRRILPDRGPLYLLTTNASHDAVIRRARCRARSASWGGCRLCRLNQPGRPIGFGPIESW
jgi:hypothetical protein